jgi:hypothetical protein
VQSVSPVGASIYCARIRTAPHVFWPEAIAARWSCGPHVAPASNRRRRCRAGVGITHLYSGTSEMCRLCCNHVTTQSADRIRMAHANSPHTMSMRQPCRGANSLRPHPDGPHAHCTSHYYYLARRAYTIANPTVPMGARKQAHIRLCGVLVKHDSHFRRKCSCRSIPPRHSTHELSPKVVIITSHTPQSLLDVGTVGLPIAYALRATMPLLLFTCIAILRAGRHEFVGNRAENEARAVCPDSSPTLVSAEGRHL